MYEEYLTSPGWIRNDLVGYETSSVRVVLNPAVALANRSDSDLPPHFQFSPFGVSSVFLMLIGLW